MSTTPRPPAPWPSITASRSRARTEDDLFLIEGLPDSGRKYNFPAYKPFVPDRWLTNGETVSLGNLTFDVVHCPGHTPGHVVFVHKPVEGRLRRRRAVPGLDRPHAISRAATTSSC